MGLLDNLTGAGYVVDPLVKTNIQPFFPKAGSTQTVTPAAASANLVVDADKLSRQVRICNTGASIAYVRIGLGAQVATTADYPVLSGNITVISKDPAHDNLAHISAAGTTLAISLGEGF